jgi:hypothetical protein
MTILSKNGDTPTGPVTGLSSGKMRRVPKYSPFFYELFYESPRHPDRVGNFLARPDQVVPKLRLLCWLCPKQSRMVNIPVRNHQFRFNIA